MLLTHREPTLEELESKIQVEIEDLKRDLQRLVPSGSAESRQFDLMLGGLSNEEVLTFIPAWLAQHGFVLPTTLQVKLEEVRSGWQQVKQRVASCPSEPPSRTDAM